MSLAFLIRIVVATVSMSCFFVLGETIPTEEFVRFNFLIALFSLSALLSNFGGIQATSKLVMSNEYDANLTATFLAFRTASLSFMIIFIYLFITNEDLIFSLYGFMFTFCFSFLEALRLFKNFKTNSTIILLQTIYGRSVIISVVPVILVIVAKYYPIKLNAENLIFYLTVGLVALSICQINNLQNFASYAKKYLSILRPNLSQSAAFLLSGYGSAIVFFEQIAVYEWLLPVDTKSYLYALRIFGLVSLIIAPITYYYQPKLSQIDTFSLWQFPVLIYLSMIQFVLGLSVLVISNYNIFHWDLKQIIAEDISITAGLLGIFLCVRSLEGISSISSIRIYLMNAHLKATVMTVPCLILSGMLYIILDLENSYQLAILSSIAVLLLHIVNIYYGSKNEV